MYRIELAPGEEALFKSIDEMAAGIANGVITSHARIWHQTSEKWLPIEFHPHYKVALTKGPPTAPRNDVQQPSRVAGPAAASAPPIFEQTATRPAATDTVAPRPAPVPPRPRPRSEPPRTEPPLSVAAAAQAAPVARSPYAPPAEQPAAPARRPAAAKPAPVMTLDAELAPAIESVMHAPLPPHPVRAATRDAGAVDTDFIEIHPRGRGRTWTVGLVAVGAVVLLGGGAAWSAFHSRAGAKPEQVPPAPVSYGAQPAVNPATPSFGAGADASSPPESAPPKPPTPAPAPTKQVDAPVTVSDAPTLVEAPKFTLGAIGISDSDRPASDRPTGMTPATLVVHYAGAYDAARAQLDRDMRLAGVGTALAPARLSAGNVGTARAAVAGAANLLRVYRRQSTTIEQSYRDSLNMLSRQLGWTPTQIAVWENRPTQLESPELAALANGLLDAMDQMLAILSSHEGGYSIAGSTISFRDAQAARDFSTARRRLSGLIAGSADSGTPAGRILRALGDTELPDAQTGS